MTKTTCKLCLSPQTSATWVGNLLLVKCRHCDGAFPANVRENIEEIYNRDYFKSWNIYDEEKEKATRQVKYLNFSHLLDRLRVRPGRSILDVGCATGYLLDVARDRGLETWGIELAQWAAEKAGERHRVFAGKLEDFDTDQTFDYITLTDLLEHVDDPIGFMKTVSDLLRPGGQVLITTPDHTSLSRKFFGHHWFQYKEEHLFYFSRRSIQVLAGRSGLEVKRVVHNRKFMNYLYLHSQFTTYHTPLVSPFFRLTGPLVPTFLQQWPVQLPISGELLAVLGK